MTEKIESTAGYFFAGLAIGSIIGVFFAPKSGEGNREYISKKVKDSDKHARKKAEELRARAEDLVESGKQLVNQTKEIAAKLEKAGDDYPPEKSKAKGV